MAKKNTMMGQSPHLSGAEKDWRAEDDLRCLMSADEIREDPKRLEAVRALAQRENLGYGQDQRHDRRQTRSKRQRLTKEETDRELHR